MKVYLAGVTVHHQLVDALRQGKEGVDSFLSKHSFVDYDLFDESIANYKPYDLDSFYDIYKRNIPTVDYLPCYGDFLLDSGAFTFLDSGVKVDWEDYTVKYGQFVKKYNIEKYFEMDIDDIVGYEEVLRLRDILENEAGRKSIPVWHNNRGKEGFIKDAKNYPYVAIGGLVSGGGEYATKLRKYFPWFINTAHQYGAKIHALGFTSISALCKYHFDSVDSTSWLAGNKFGFLWKFNGKSLVQIDKPVNTRISNPRFTRLNNYIEWCKFQKYAEVHL